MDTSLLMFALALVQTFALVDGIVVRAGTSSPMARAEVTLSQEGTAAPMLTTSTDEAGRFAFRDVLPGEYRLAANRSGYVSRRDHLQSSGSEARRIRLMPGQETRNLELKLTPLGAV